MGMMAGMMNVDEFLSARLSEEEHLARESHSILLLIGGDPRVLIEGSDERNTYLFIERFNPARVLREIESKRLLINDLSHPENCFSIAPEGPCGGCENVGCRNLRSLAIAYSDHPDFDPAWAE